MENSIRYSDNSEPPIEKILPIYQLNNWSSAEKPEALRKALLASHTFITAWDGDTLVGVGNAITDGHLVVYYPHLLVLPEYQGRGIGKEIMQQLTARYEGFHQHILLAYGTALDFYHKCGFSKTNPLEAMWIYDANDY